VKTEVVIGVSVAGFIIALATLFICVCLNKRSRKRKGGGVMPERTSVAIYGKLPERVFTYSL
jgi:hypothetical protein